jgi:hypothetical protein
MLDKEYFDKWMPAGIALESIAARITGRRGDFDVLHALNWMAAFQESDRFSRWPDQMKPWDRPAGDWWNLSFRGLQYKGSESYLTAEGWPCGTMCWYVCVECGWREFVCAEGMSTAVARAVLLIEALRLWRPTDRKRSMEAYLEDLCSPLKRAA